MLYLSSLLKTIPKYAASAENLFAALSGCGEKFTLFDGAKDIWARDYMPVKTKSGKYISFRYEPGYLKGYETQRTDYRKDLAPHFELPVTYSLAFDPLLYPSSKAVSLSSFRSEGALCPLPP